MSAIECRRFRLKVEWRLRGRTLALGETTRVMGIVNITPDSFSDGGLYLQADRAIDHAVRLIDEGADIVDFGAESTRPGSGAHRVDYAAMRSRRDNQKIASAEEEDRLLPVLEGVLKLRPGAVISVDTYHSQTARAAIAAGAQIVNDVSGFTWDAEMAAACAELRCGVVLMHTRGLPSEWNTLSALTEESVLPLVRDGLMASLQQARQAGIPDDAIVLDPGYGFGKRLKENYPLLARQAELLSIGRPLLVGLSRKSFLSANSRRQRGAAESDFQEARVSSSLEAASIAGLTAAILEGASIVRVHRVSDAVEAAAVADAILAAGREG